MEKYADLPNVYHQPAMAGQHRVFRNRGHAGKYWLLREKKAVADNPQHQLNVGLHILKQTFQRILS